MEYVAPAVVAVVVTCEPAPFLDETLRALGSQDYPNLSVLVIDAGSKADVTPRVASVLPNAFVRRLQSNSGFATTANEALKVVSGATHLVLCHDDVAPAPDAVTLMVEEAFRSNAGIVTPKFVEWEDPSRLVQVGMGADKSGAVTSRVEAGELDQQQHDSVRDVFVAPGGCTLVREDLFATLRGFDEAMFLFGEDLDLSWRAQIAGARVVVAPAAHVRHVQAIDRGFRELSLGGVTKNALARRNELRAVLKNYSGWNLARVLPQVLALSAVETIYNLLSGKPERAWDIVSAWCWNLGRLRELRRARKELHSHRLLLDADVRRSQTRGSARLAAFVRTRLAQPANTQRRRGALVGDWSQRAKRTDAPSLGASLVFWGAIAIVLAFGGRNLVFHPLPLVGQLAPFPAPSTLLERFASGWNGAAMGGHPPSLGLAGISGALLFGSTGLLQKILLLGALPLGVVGSYRLCRRLPSRLAGMAGAAVYAVMPLAYNEMASGRLQALLVYGAAPWILARLLAASGLKPFGSRSGWNPRDWRELARHGFPLGVIVALLAAMVPAGVVVTAAMTLALAAGMVLVGSRQAGVRVAMVGAAALGVTAVALFPSTLELLRPGAQLASLTGLASSPTNAPGLGAVLRFETGGLGGGPVGWVFVVVGLLPVLIGRGWRLMWAARLWAVAVVSWALAWMAGQGWLGSAVPPADVLLAPGAVAVSVNVALGLTALEADLPRFRFGWRQVAPLLVGALLFLGTLPVAYSSLGGSWNMPAQGFGVALSWLPPEKLHGAYKVLWLGDPQAIPAASRRAGPGLAYATTSSGLPDATDLWAGSSSGATVRMGAALEAAAEGRTSTLGHLIAPMGVRYVVVPNRAAPPAPDQPLLPNLSPPPSFINSLLAQNDLRDLGKYQGLLVLENTSWIPGASPATAPPGSGLRDAVAALELAIWACLSGALVWLARGRHREERQSAGIVPRQPDRQRELAGVGAAPPGTPGGVNPVRWTE